MSEHGPPGISIHVRNKSWRVAQRKADLTQSGARLIIDVESQLDMPISVRNRIKELRDGRNWTQQQLADAVGVSRQSINSIERDRYVPSLVLALTCARVFETPVDRISTLERKK